MEQECIDLQEAIASLEAGTSCASEKFVDDVGGQVKLLQQELIQKMQRRDSQHHHVEMWRDWVLSRSPEKYGSLSPQVTEQLQLRPSSREQRKQLFSGTVDSDCPSPQSLLNSAGADPTEMIHVL
jgi:hypothetical protein